jgi:uncharacterized lipoprotein YehR (DUF1307 family)
MDGRYFKFLSKPNKKGEVNYETFDVWAVVVAIVLVVGLCGCGGGGTEVKTQSYATTLGQELDDLAKAYKNGIITEKQYNDAKEKLIKQRTQN